MVFLNGLKYACQACIKGHRSSSCAHTDRALFEIKKKGRPVTQCEHCRQLRKTKQVHVKCSCEGGDDNEPKESRGKAKRKIPTQAAFPDGLTGQSLSPSPAPQLKSKRSGGCSCKSAGHCGCATPVIQKTNRSRIRAASSDAPSVPATLPSLPSVSSCCSGKSRPNYDPKPHVQPNIHAESSPPASLVRLATQNQATAPYHASDSYIDSLFSWPPGVGMGTCSCGVTCACPGAFIFYKLSHSFTHPRAGCYEHSDPSTAFTSSQKPIQEDPSWNLDGGSETQVPDVWSATHPVSPPLASTSTSSTIPAPPRFITSALSLASPSDDCCGGSCQCTAQAIPCQCAAECCGCCFGCSCSDDSQSTGADPEEDVRERLRFAVSGERGSCCSENKDQDGTATRKKRQKVEKNHVHEDSEVHLYPLQPIEESPTVPLPHSNMTASSAQNPDSSYKVYFPSAPGNSSLLNHGSEERLPSNEWT